MSGAFGWANAVAFTVGSQSVKWSDLVGNICALATVGLAVRRSLLTWPVQIIASALLFGASMSAHLGGNAARQVVLGAMAGYGWWRWQRGIRTTNEVPVRFANTRERLLLLVTLALGTVAFAEILQATHASWAPWPDAYIFIGSVVATLAQARGWVEFWGVWVLVDCVGVPLAWTHGLVVSGAVYGVFLVLCAIGIRDWILRSRQPLPEAVPA
jgi:nicotinamide mononucleotide transporter